MSDHDLAKLDMLAATEVMGWTYHGGSRYYDKGSSGFHLDAWQPTRRIEQAWELLEKLGFNFCVTHNKKEPTQYFCFIDDFEAYAETAPLAIVIACLRAKGINLDQEVPK